MRWRWPCSRWLRWCCWPRWSPGRCARRCSRCARSRSTANYRAATWPRCAPTRCRAWPATSSASTSSAAVRPSNRCPGCARPWCAAYGRTGWPSRWKSTAPRRCGRARRQDRGSEKLVNHARRSLRGQPRRCRGREPGHAGRARGQLGAGAGHAAPPGRHAGPDGARIDTLKLSSRGSWHAELDSGADLELGRGSEDEVVARTARFVRTLRAGHAALCRLPAAARGAARGRPAPPRRLCAAPARRLDDRRGRGKTPRAALNTTTKDTEMRPPTLTSFAAPAVEGPFVALGANALRAAGRALIWPQRNTRTWWWAWTSAPPR